jgi:hypothetical protein
VVVPDPFGNVFFFEGKDQSAFARKIDVVKPRMRAYVQAQLDAGRELPTPEEVRAVVGPPLGAAIDVLNEFPGYAEAYARIKREP